LDIIICDGVDMSSQPAILHPVVITGGFPFSSKVNRLVTSNGFYWSDVVLIMQDNFC